MELFDCNVTDVAKDQSGQNKALSRGHSMTTRQILYYDTQTYCMKSHSNDTANKPLMIEGVVNNGRKCN